MITDSDVCNCSLPNTNHSCEISFENWKGIATHQPCIIRALQPTKNINKWKYQLTSDKQNDETNKSMICQINNCHVEKQAWTRRVRYLFITSANWSKSLSVVQDLTHAIWRTGARQSAGVQCTVHRAKSGSLGLTRLDPARARLCFVLVGPAQILNARCVGWHCLLRPNDSWLE